MKLDELEWKAAGGTLYDYFEVAEIPPDWSVWRCVKPSLNHEVGYVTILSPNDGEYWRLEPLQAQAVLLHITSQGKNGGVDGDEVRGM